MYFSNEKTRAPYHIVVCAFPAVCAPKHAARALLAGTYKRLLQRSLVCESMVIEGDSGWRQVIAPGRNVYFQSENTHKTGHTPFVIAANAPGRKVLSYFRYSVALFVQTH
jgi:hypothetical protein